VVLAAKEVAAQLVGQVPVVKVFARGEDGAEPVMEQWERAVPHHLIADPPNRFARYRDLPCQWRAVGLADGPVS
jgi:hypothetical protein